MLNWCLNTVSLPEFGSHVHTTTLITNEQFGYQIQNSLNSPISEHCENVREVALTAQVQCPYHLQRTIFRRAIAVHHGNRSPDSDPSSRVTVIYRYHFVEYNI